MIENQRRQQQFSKIWLGRPILADAIGQVVSIAAKMVRQGYRPLAQNDERRSSSNGRVRISEPNPGNEEEERLGINRRPTILGRIRLFDEVPVSNRRIERSVSNGRGPIAQRSHQESSPRAVSTGRPGLYERNKESDAKRAAKLQMVRKEMMQECTFTPKTLASSSSTSRTTATNASSETKGVINDVYERLYRHAGNVSTPIKGRSRAGSSSIHQPSPNSSLSRSGSACSSRIEELYQDGVRKIRSRRMTEEQERALRSTRLDQKDILECTFRPKTHWKGRVVATQNVGQGRIGISPRDRALRSPPMTKKKHASPPQEILVASPSDIRHSWTPTRSHITAATPTTDYHETVSPLHDPSVVVYEDTTSIDDSTLLPRIYIGSTVGNSLAETVSCMTQTDATEYGSI